MIYRRLIVMKTTFKVMSIHLGLFYAKWLGKCTNWSFMYTFFILDIEELYPKYEFPWPDFLVMVIQIYTFCLDLSFFLCFF